MRFSLFPTPGGAVKVAYGEAARNQRLLGLQPNNGMVCWAGEVSRIQYSASSTCSRKPIQNATPKNCRGASPESRLVAKNSPTIGRIVTTAIPVEKARIIHRRCRGTF